MMRATLVLALAISTGTLASAEEPTAVPDGVLPTEVDEVPAAPQPDAWHATPPTELRTACDAEEAPEDFCRDLQAKSTLDLNTRLAPAIVAQLLASTKATKRSSDIGDADSSPTQATTDVGTTGSVLQGSAVPDVRPTETFGLSTALVGSGDSARAMTALSFNLPAIIAGSKGDKYLGLSRTSDISVLLPFNLTNGDGSSSLATSTIDYVGVRARISGNAMATSEYNQRFEKVESIVNDLGKADSETLQEIQDCLDAVGKEKRIETSIQLAKGDFSDCPSLKQAVGKYVDADSRFNQAATDFLKDLDRGYWGFDLGADIGDPNKILTNSVQVDASFAGGKTIQPNDATKGIVIKGSGTYQYHTWMADAARETRSSAKGSFSFGGAFEFDNATEVKSVMTLDAGVSLTTDFERDNTYDPYTDRLDVRANLRIPLNGTMGLSINAIYPVPLFPTSAGVQENKDLYKPTAAITLDWSALTRALQKK